MRTTTFLPAAAAFLAMTAPHILSAGEAHVGGLSWRQGEDLPDPNGRKGLYGGVSNGHLLLAGGSNFPVPWREGGRKAFHRDAFVRKLPLTTGEPWTVVHDALPVSLGEGAVVSTLAGVLALGGHDGRGSVATVMLPHRQALASQATRAQTGCRA